MVDLHGALRECAAASGGPNPADWLVGGGELGALIRSYDWSATVLGARELWPQSLRTAVSMVVDCPFPAALLWGREWRLLYNDAFRDVAGTSHPGALGRPALEAWPQLSPLADPVLAAVAARGERFFFEDGRFPTGGQGRTKDASFAISYGPVRLEDGSVGGALVTLQERPRPRAFVRPLSESESLLRTVIDNLREGLSLLDLRTKRRVLMSPSHEELTGFTLDELSRLTGDEIEARVHPEDRRTFHELQRKAAEGQDPGRDRVEYRWQVKSGEYRWFSDSRRLIRDAQGRPSALVVVSRDVTDRRRAADELRRSREDLDRAQEVGQLGWWRLDTRHDALTWSAEMHRIFEVPAGASPTYESFLRLVHPDDRERVDGYRRRAGERGEPYDLELRFVVDGRVKWVREKAYPELGQGGELRGCFGIAQDVTARRQAEEALRESERGLRLANEQLSVERSTLEAIIRTLPVGIGITDARGVPLTLNEAALSLNEFGSVAEMLENLERYPELFALRRLDGTRLPFEDWPVLRACRGERVEEEELRLLSVRSGTERTICVTVVPVRDSEGQVVLLVCLMRDVTQRKQAEEALHAANEQLSEVDRRKNGFLAMLSHELRNPLAPIRSSLFVLERAEPGGEQARRAQAVIARQAEHLRRLVDDLLDVTRITRGKLQLRREPLELDELARRTVEDHRSVFAACGIFLELESAPRELWVRGDRTRLVQALGNLLHNAAKFTPRDGRTTVSLEVDPGARQAIVRVRDTGAGIAPQVLPRLFEAFTQAETTLDRSKGGLGLGLALVKGLIERHGGTVRGESEGLGKGATFSFALPLGAPTEPDRPRTPGRGADAAGPTRVLVIEDNADSAESLREALGLGGHVVEVAPDGPTGLRKARAFRPDVVLCDIGLPGMDGYAVAAAMRADPELGHVPLMALTGYAQPEDVAHAREAGFAVHLAKPPDLEALEAALTQACASDGEG
ncbi:MAG: PAS domain S-box protein [Myxococcales bacterium]